MTRHTTFTFCLAPTVEQSHVLARHAGASRFAFNQCLRIVKTALDQRRTDPNVNVPWTRFDLINVFNSWKKSGDAGRVIAVDPKGVAAVVAAGLPWRARVCQEVFEEAAVDCAGALAAWSNSRSGKRKGKRVGFPKFKKKTMDGLSFRLRNRHRQGRESAIRVGANGRLRSVTLPVVGSIAVHDDTRRLRRMLTGGRAKILFATVTRRGGRWWISLNIEAADLHPARRHRERDDKDHGGWIGIDLGLSTFLVAAQCDGTEVARVDDAPNALAAGIKRQRQLAKALSRKQKGSRNRTDAANALRRHHRHVANIRRHFLHWMSNELVKTHDRLVVENLNVSGMARNRRLARAISDAGWAEFARLLRYKQEWRRGTVVTADRWYPSSKLCAACGAINVGLTLADRVFICNCGYSDDRDRNAAVNLARWGKAHQARHPEPRTSKQRGRANNARRRDGAGQNGACSGETSPEDVGTDVQAAPAV